MEVMRITEETLSDDDDDVYGNDLYVRCYQHTHYCLIRSVNLVLIKRASMTKWSVSAL
jgi:hypothetical protein